MCDVTAEAMVAVVKVAKIACGSGCCVVACVAFTKMHSVVVVFRESCQKCWCEGVHVEVINARFNANVYVDCVVDDAIVARGIVQSAELLCKKLM